MVIKRAPFITKPLSGYYHTEVPEDDKELTRCGPGTPAGEYLRRFWQPILVTHQLEEAPFALKRFCEDLVAFRDKSGRIGLLQLHCSHCGTSLEFGQIEEDGIRCRQNGWKFAADGRTLDTPGAPPDSTVKDGLCQGAYPVTELGGLVFAYMGPPEKMPDFPMFDLYEMPGHHLEPGRHLALGSGEGPVPNPKPCNWLQIVDNLVDPLHEQILHATISGIQFKDRNGRLVEELTLKGQGGFVETSTGIITLETRRVSDDTVWVRNIEYLWPNMCIIGGSHVFPHEWGPGRTEEHAVPRTLFWAVPVDDHNMVEIDLVCVPDGDVYQPPKFDAPPPPMDQPATGGEGNRGGRTYERMQRTPGDYEAQIGQRTIAVHGMEHLGVSDKGVTMMRKGLRQKMRMVQQGQDPPELKPLSEKMVPTYGGDSLLRVDRATTPEEDKELIGEKALEMAQRYVQTPPNLPNPAQ
jgi:phenylpropionate dioxygenase-like ring-hydroxylating dioxygenase large terminal subunit